MFKVFNNINPYTINKTFPLMSTSHNTMSLNNVSTLVLYI